MEVDQGNVCRAEDLTRGRYTALPHDVCSVVQEIFTNYLVALLSCEVQGRYPYHKLLVCIGEVDERMNVLAAEQKVAHCL
jgi:hypothetical protein